MPNDKMVTAKEHCINSGKEICFVNLMLRFVLNVFRAALLFLIIATKIHLYG